MQAVSSMILDSSSAIKLMMGGQMLKERALMARNDVWHKIKIIRAARYDKEVVLRAVLSAVKPADLIPVRYETINEDASFMARNCGAALEKLCQTNLIIDISNGNHTVLIVTLAFATIHDLKINIQPILLSALTRRYHSDSKYLELENFHRDPDIAKTVYCPLSQTKTLAHTLKLARTALGPCLRLGLRRNELTTLAALESSDLASLRTLDLRRNDILAMSALVALKNAPVEELWLDGNPLCENYRKPQRYVASAKLYCPNLKKLDGVDVDAPKLPITRDNYYSKNSQSPRIVEQFFEHFFKIYDSADRDSLRALYRKDSLYSMTLDVLPNDQTGQTFGAFSLENRNLLGSCDTKESRKLLYRGADEITEAFKRLPETLHDRPNFRYDVMWEDHRCIVVNVEGFFETINDASPTRLYAFSRSFVLASCGANENEYYLLNDQYHVIVPHPFTVFFHKIDRAEIEEENDERAVSDTQARERMISTMNGLTTMNTEWCRKYLQDANWNAAEALERFVESYKLSSIPAEAFRR